MKRIKIKFPDLSFLVGHIQVFFQKFILTVDLFFKNELLNHAAAAAFFFILSVTPIFLLLLFSFDRYLASYPDISEMFFSFLKKLNENLDKDLFVRIGLLRSEITAIGVFGLLSLIWSGCWILSSIQMGLAIVFPTHKTRKYLAMSILSVVILIFLLFVSFLSTLISIGLNFFHKFLESEFIVLSFMQALIPYINSFLPIIVIFIVIFVAYRFVPLQNPGNGSSLAGAMWCTLAIILMHSIFTRLADVGRFNVIYGVLGSLIFSFLWVQFTFILFFFFAEFTFVTDKVDILLLEKMFFYKFKQNIKVKWLDKLLFEQPRYIFEKYGKNYDPEDVLFREGDQVDEIYYVHRGSIGIYRQHVEAEEKIATIREGEVFGEMAYLLEENRTATAIAETESNLLIINPELFEELIHTNREFSRDVIKLLSERVRKTNLSLQSSSNGPILT
jgi:membrane protein